MQIIRTITWIVLTAILVGFVVMNWGQKVPVNFWPQDSGTPLHFDWPVAIVALFFLLIGFVPMWIYARAIRWRLSRRIATLENAMRAVMPTETAAPAHTDPVVTEPVILDPHTPVESPR